MVNEKDSIHGQTHDDTITTTETNSPLSRNASHDSSETQRSEQHEAERSQRQHGNVHETDVEKGLALKAIKTHQSQGPTRENANSALDLVHSHISHQDLHASTATFREENAEQYLRFSPRRKIVIVAILSFCSLLAPVSSTSILSAVPEVAETFNTTGSVINASNAVYMVFMGIAATFWGTLSQVWGRRPICIASSFLFFVFSVATALTPNLPAYFIFRALTAFPGTSFLVVGSSALGDIYTPTERGTALSWFLSGTLIGPAFGPFLGGVIVTFRSWRVIFWLQSALAGLALAMVLILFPETIAHKGISDFDEMPPAKRAYAIWRRVNPVPVVIMLFEYPNLSLAAITAAALVWNQYSLLAPIRYVLNPRFNLTSPIQSGLFYIAPGCGYLVGTLVGGRYADYVVKKWIRKRDGVRVPEDRLKSCLVFLGLIVPGFIVIYGWTVEKKVGGIAVPVLAMFFQGVAQLFCFPSLNTYCLDVMQSKGRSAEVVAGNYLFRYAFAALGTGVVLPAVETMGVGWFSTITALFLVSSGGLMWLTTEFGAQWRQKVDEKRSRKSALNN